MAKAPAHRGREIVPDQVDALSREECPRLQAAEKRDFVQPRLDETRWHAPQLVIHISGMDHQLGDPRTDGGNQPSQRIARENAGIEASDETRRPDAERSRRSIVAPRP